MTQCLRQMSRKSKLKCNTWQSQIIKHGESVLQSLKTPPLQLPVLLNIHSNHCQVGCTSRLVVQEQLLILFAIHITDPLAGGQVKHRVSKPVSARLQMVDSAER